MKIRTMFVVLSVFSSFFINTCHASEPVLTQEPPRTKLSFGLAQVLDGSYNKTKPHPLQEVMHPDPLKIFLKYFGIMFTPEFPAPVHPEATIVKGFDCLHDRCAEVNKVVLPKLDQFTELVRQLNEELDTFELPLLNQAVVSAMLSELDKARAALQQKQLDKTLALHKKALKGYATKVLALADDIKGFPCDACKEGAAYEFTNHESQDK